jgi:hypothetical protein
MPPGVAVPWRHAGVGAEGIRARILQIVDRHSLPEEAREVSFMVDDRRRRTPRPTPRLIAPMVQPKERREIHR